MLILTYVHTSLKLEVFYILIAIVFIKPTVKITATISGSTIFLADIQKRANIFSDPKHNEFQTLPSGRRYRIHRWKLTHYLLTLLHVTVYNTT